MNGERLDTQADSGVLAEIDGTRKIDPGSVAVKQLVRRYLIST
jgi:hypothetical protein